MILIIIALITLAVLGFVLLVWATDNDIFAGLIVGICCVMGAGIGLITYAFVGWSYIAAEYKADIINREYGTNYSQAEVYWAADVIDTVRELDRKRIELNGDLLRDEK